MIKRQSNTTILLSAIAFVAGVLVAVLCMTMLGAGGATPGGDGSAVGGGPMHGGRPPAMVRVGYVKAENLQQRTGVVGRLRELRRAIVAAEAEGKVLAVPVQEGDPVVGGETVLAEIDGVWARLELARTQARVASAQATVDQSVLDLDYLEQLLNAKSAKPKEVQDMRAHVQSDRATLDASIADRDRAEKEVQRLIVIAPFNGSVTRKATEVGQWVERGDEMVEVISNGGIDAVADVPEDLIDQIKLGDNAQVVIDPLTLTVDGEVAAVNSNGGNSARTFPVKVRLDDRSGRLKPGMSATVWLAVGPEKDCLTVPRDAVVYGPDSQTVWYAKPGETQDAKPTAEVVPVRVLFGEGDRVVIDPLSGGALTEGVAVVTEGVERLSPGQPLDIENDTRPAE